MSNESPRLSIRWICLLLAVWCFGYMCGPPGATLAQQVNKSISDLFVLGKVQVADPSDPKSVKTTLAENGDAQFGGEVKVSGKLILGEGKGGDVKAQLETLSANTRAMAQRLDALEKRSWPNGLVHGSGQVKPGVQTEILNAVSTSGIAFIHWEDGYRRTEAVLINVPQDDHSRCATSVITAHTNSGVDGDLDKIGYGINEINGGKGPIQFSLKATITRIAGKHAQKLVNFRVTFIPF